MMKLELRGNKTLVRSLVLGIAAILLSVFISKKLSAPKEAKAPLTSFRTKTVEVSEVVLQSNRLNVVASGRLKAQNRFEVYAEVTGVLQNANFRKGARIAAGSPIAVIDSKEFEGQLKSQRSAFLGLVSQVMPDIQIDHSSEFASWEAFIQKIQVEKSLPELPVVNSTSLKKFLSARSVLTTYYNIKSLEERLAKYRISAPYLGVLVETNIEPGALVRAGQKIGTFVQPGVFELEASVVPSQLKYLREGQSVQLTSEGKAYSGRILRFNEVVDLQTQMVCVIIQINHPELKEGQFFEMNIAAAEVNGSIEIARNLLSNEQTVFLVNEKDSTLVVKPVIVHGYKGQKALVSGLEAGTILVNQQISGGFEGMKVVPQTAGK
jgi:membrane fusion protein (multidrug efflux system)